MAISTAKIQASAKAISEYQKGMKLYESGAVSILRADSFWKGETNLSAAVELSALTDTESVNRGVRSATVVMSVTEEQIRHYSCNVPGCMNGGYGLCRHAVAVALFVSNKGSVSADAVAPTRIVTPPATRQLINDYATKNWSRALICNQPRRNVQLMPRLRMDGCSVSVSFFIGSEHSYVLKNLTEFVDNLNHRRYHEYGKKLAFYHTEEAFTEESVGYIRFIMRELAAVGQQSAIQPGGWYKKTNSAESARNIPLNPVSADEFMDIVLAGAQRVCIEDTMGTPREVTVVETSPALSLQIQTHGKDGVKVSLGKKKIKLLEGKRRLYLYDEDGNMLYAADEECRESMGPFLKMVLNNGLRAGIADRSVEMNLEDYPKFCTEVLEEMKPYVEIQAQEAVNPEQFLPDPLINRFYFDMPSPSEVTCRLEQSYGEVAFNPLDPAGEGLDRNLHRDYHGEMKVRDVILRYFGHRTEQGQFILSGDDEIYELLSRGIPEFMALGELFVSEEFQRLQKVKETPNIHVKVSRKSDLLSMELSVDDMEQAELAQLLENYRRKKRYYRLKDGTFVNLMEERLETVSNLLEGATDSAVFPKDGAVTVSKYRMLYAANLLNEEEDSFASVSGTEWIQGQLEGLDFACLDRKDISGHETMQLLPEHMRETLRPYQMSGVVWMKMLSDHGFGGILADEMGLGKTIEVIALLQTAQESAASPARKKVEPEAQASTETSAQQSEMGKLTYHSHTSLIVCPASLVYNWESELRRFAEELSVLVISGDVDEREKLIAACMDYDVVITSYDLMRRDVQLYSDYVFDYQMIDEAQYIKNHDTLNAKTVKQIQAKHKFALTGTPIENRLSELWSIFDYCMPGFFRGYDRFRTDYEVPIVKNEDGKALERLQKMTAPFIMRRLKKDVLTELPEKQENVVYAKLSGEQRRLYLAEALSIQNAVSGKSEGEFARERIQILAELTKLRQICCDPVLCFENYQGESAKLETCMDLLREATESGHKVLVFSQFTTMLDLIRVRLEQENMGYLLLTGSVAKEERIRLVNRFQKGDIPVFLISLKAGGTGLNLTAADIVIHFDPWWNVAAQNQATDRVHRIGQKRAVNVYKLIAKDTVEEKILKLQETKKELAESVIGQRDTGFSGISKEELLELLR